MSLLFLERISPNFFHRTLWCVLLARGDEKENALCTFLLLTFSCWGQRNGLYCRLKGLQRQIFFKKKVGGRFRRAAKCLGTEVTELCFLPTSRAFDLRWQWKNSQRPFPQISPALHGIPGCLCLLSAGGSFLLPEETSAAFCFNSS